MPENPLTNFVEKLNRKVDKSDLENILAHEIDLQIRGKTFVDETLLDAKFQIWKSQTAILMETENQESPSSHDLNIIQVEISNLKQQMLNIENDLNTKHNTGQIKTQGQGQTPDIVQNLIRSSSVPLLLEFDEPDGSFSHSISTTNTSFESEDTRLSEKMKNLQKKVRKLEKNLTATIAQSGEQVKLCTKVLFVETTCNGNPFDITICRTHF